MGPLSFLGFKEHYPFIFQFQLEIKNEPTLIILGGGGIVRDALIK